MRPLTHPTAAPGLFVETNEYVGMPADEVKARVRHALWTTVRFCLLASLVCAAQPTEVCALLVDHYDHLVELFLTVPVPQLVVFLLRLERKRFTREQLTFVLLPTVTSALAALYGQALVVVSKLAREGRGEDEIVPADGFYWRAGITDGSVESRPVKSLRVSRQCGCTGTELTSN